MIPPQRLRKDVFWLGLTLPLVALLTMGWLTYETNIQFKNSFNWVTSTYQILNVVDQTRTDIANAETGQRGYLLTGREDYLEPYQTAMAAINTDIQRLYVLFNDSPAQQTNIIMLQNLVAKRLSLDTQTIDINETNTSAAVAVALTDQGKNTMDQTRNVLFRMRQEEEHLLNERQQGAENSFFYSEIASLALVGVDLLALGFIAVILLRLEKLHQFVTVCAWTGQVKYEGQWIRLEEYLKRRFGLSVSHGLSKEAATKMAAEIQELNHPQSGTDPNRPHNT
jgi:CHASE3 domain sensor protein